MKNILKKYNICVIGGGAAGMMAAGRAAELGANVVLIEKNKILGKKLMITGKGRCNITNAENDLKKLVSEYGANGKFLFSALSRFNTDDVIRFFEEHGVKIKVERGNRVFPASDKAQDVVCALENYLKEENVEIILNAKVEDIIAKGGHIEKIKLKNGEIKADKYIIATGGASYPATGSCGDGYLWGKKFAHTIIDPKPALAPIKIKEKWIKNLQGLSLKNAELSIWQNNKKKLSYFGEMLFTHFGISGPIVLDMSKKVGKMLEGKKEFALSIDLKPALDFKTLDNRIQRDFKKYQNKNFKNCLGDLMPKKLIKTIIELSGVDEEKEANLITREERKKITHLLKGLKMQATGLMGFDMAIITSGGVSISEVSPKTMQSKIIDNLYFAGEILDIDGPTGGYNLQVAWSTGYIAGEQAGE